MAVSRRNIYWTVLATKQANSTDAVRHLRDQGIITYNPTYKEAPFRGVRRRLSVLPNYLFARVDLRTRWQVLHSTRGVSRVFIGENLLPAFCPDRHVKYFKSLEVDDYVVLRSEEPPVHSPGDIVTGSRGLFEDMKGRYVGLGQGPRATARVIFEILGQPVEFQVSAYDLAAA